jgi:aminopeptidase-like protein
MPVDDVHSNAKEIEYYFDKLWPICRSITGDGLRESFEIIKEIIPLTLHEVSSGSAVYDWTVPDEWNISDAYILTPDGNKIAEFKKNNLHVVNYSVPVDMQCSFQELEPHLFYRKDIPDAVPYITSYYKRQWGFCIDYNTYLTLPREGNYRVIIDSTLKPGSLTYGDLLVPGDSEEEILFTSYLCHPSMANNELSGPLTLAYLYKQLNKRKKRRYSLRFVIAPETIGAICYLNRNSKSLTDNVRAGFIFTCCGDPGPITYKMTRSDNSLVNKIVKHVLKHAGFVYNVIPFDPIGSDERQYSSPGFNLPVGVIMRTPFSEYPEYHTSHDNKHIMDFGKMQQLVNVMYKIIDTFEINQKYINQIMYGEPFMGKRQLYEDLGSRKSHSENLKMRMRLLNYMDGQNDIIDFCEKYNYDAIDVSTQVSLLLENGLIK